MQRKSIIVISVIVLIASLMTVAFGCAGSSIDVRELASIHVSGANASGIPN